VIHDYVHKKSKKHEMVDAAELYEPERVEEASTYLQEDSF
jgi:hypothetical protein